MRQGRRDGAKAREQCLHKQFWLHAAGAASSLAGNRSLFSPPAWDQARSCCSPHLSCCQRGSSCEARSSRTPRAALLNSSTTCSRGQGRWEAGRQYRGRAGGARSARVQQIAVGRRSGGAEGRGRGQGGCRSRQAVGGAPLGVSACGAQSPSVPHSPRSSWRGAAAWDKGGPGAQGGLSINLGWGIEAVRDGRWWSPSRDYVWPTFKQAVLGSSCFAPQ